MGQTMEQSVQNVVRFRIENSLLIKYLRVKSWDARLWSVGVRWSQKSYSWVSHCLWTFLTCNRMYPKIPTFWSWSEHRYKWLHLTRSWTLLGRRFQRYSSIWKTQPLLGLTSMSHRSTPREFSCKANPRRSSNNWLKNLAGAKSSYKGRRMLMRGMMSLVQELQKLKIWLC